MDDKNPQSKKPTRLKLFIILGLIFIILVAGGVFLYLKPPAFIANRTSGNFLAGKPTDLPKKDEITGDLPAGASTVRLNLPTSIANLMISQKNGLGGLGVQTDDPKVFDFVWMDVKTGTEIKSIASGKVTKINQKGFLNYEIIINYSYGLWGRYQGIKKPMVNVGDLVRENQVVGLGMSGSQTGSDLLAFSIADENISPPAGGGTKSSFSPGVLVKPLDYLKPDVKAIILAKYK